MSEGSAPTAFFNKTYDEAYGLLVEARNYIAYEEAAARAALAVLDRLRLSCEATRLTARLTHIMSWLLYQKAICAGEISRREAANGACRLDGHGVCLMEPLAGGSLPPRFLDILDRSRRLFVRVSRLDAMMAE